MLSVTLSASALRRAIILQRLYGVFSLGRNSTGSGVASQITTLPPTEFINRFPSELNATLPSPPLSEINS
jgi:hypothetical protein